MLLFTLSHTLSVSVKSLSLFFLDLKASENYLISKNQKNKLFSQVVISVKCWRIFQRRSTFSSCRKQSGNSCQIVLFGTEQIIICQISEIENYFCFVLFCFANKQFGTTVYYVKFSGLLSPLSGISC